MIPSFAKRMLTETDPRVLMEVRLQLRLQGHAVGRALQARLKRGEYFPPFLFISIINSCNLRCQGCWVDVEAPRQRSTRGPEPHLVNDAKRTATASSASSAASRSCTRAAGHLAAHPDCYFQVFTNGQFITDEVAARAAAAGQRHAADQHRGHEVVSDERRGG
jgi:hypothetical protein